MTIRLRILTAGACLALSSSSFAVTLQLNFGTSVSITGWNNITSTIGTADSGTLANLVDSTGGATTADFNMITKFGAINTNGASTSTFDIPSAVSASSLYGNVVANGSVLAPTPTFKLSSLDTNLAYSFKIYASRTGVTATAEKRTGTYTATGLNSLSGSLNATNNTSLTLTLLDVRPDASGNIVFDIKAADDNDNANKFFYLNALTITSTAIPEPTTYASLAGVAILILALHRRRR